MTDGDAAPPGSLWHRNPALAYAAVFVGVIGHASSEFVSVLTGLAGPETSVWRFVLGSAGLLVFALMFRETRNLIAPLREHGVRIVLFSLIGVTGAYLAFHWSLDFATVPQVATVVTTIPIFVALVNLRINRQPISTAKWVSGIAAVIGVAVIVTGGALNELAGSGGQMFGIFLALLCAMLFAIYMVNMRPIIAEYGALRITALTLTIGSVALWALVGIAWGKWVNPATLFDRPPGEAWAIAVLAIFNTTITQFLWIGGLAAVPDITRGSYLFFLKPVIAATLAVVFLGTTLSPTVIIAIVVICAAVVLEANWHQLFGKQRSGPA